MPRYKIFIEYDGTGYSGWQKQPNADTVEEQIEKALSQILGHTIDIIGQGRTDRGVHAEAQVAHFDYPDSIKTEDLLYALLGVLPGDISVWNIKQVESDFHARFDAKFRQYRYQIITWPSPLWRHTATFIRDDLNEEAMLQCANMIEGRHDFSSFSRENEDRKDAVCTVEHSLLEREDFRIIYGIRANRFVHHMVRRLVGSMVQVAKGKRRVDWFQDMLHHPEAGEKAHGIAAKGLILESVEY